MKVKVYASNGSYNIIDTNSQEMPLREQLPETPKYIKLLHLTKLINHGFFRPRFKLTDYGVVWTRNPKAASTSILIGLLENGVYLQQTHLPLSMLSSYKHFVYVRHPYDRLCSSYRHLVLREPEKQKNFYKRYGRLGFTNNMTFNKFAEIVSNLPPRLDNGHWMPQYYLLKYSKVNFDYVLKFERLQDDFDWFCAQIGMQRIQIPFRNPSPKKMGWQEMMKDVQPAIRHKLDRKYEPDFNLFQYES